MTTIFFQENPIRFENIWFNVLFLVQSIHLGENHETYPVGNCNPGPHLV